ncbi:MAG: hypothetical protein NTW14_06910 [bacterium]|nr:hypothetical protein [bacterium]
MTKSLIRHEFIRTPNSQAFFPSGTLFVIMTNSMRLKKQQLLDADLLIK